MITAICFLMLFTMIGGYGVAWYYTYIFVDDHLPERWDYPFTNDDISFIVGFLWPIFWGTFAIYNLPHFGKKAYTVASEQVAYYLRF